ncbi:hypothetical protein [Phenylobacterium zucineum]|uniref:hypothetical protein n=1 Tax=Phenylobacterium zucineum TaxID=284016 RepID=UPI0011D13989|nr:hypothetical protein [Phenylobacterium zucineum]
MGDIAAARSPDPLKTGARRAQIQFIRDVALANVLKFMKMNGLFFWHDLRCSIRIGGRRRRGCG